VRGFLTVAGTSINGYLARCSVFRMGFDEKGRVFEISSLRWIQAGTSTLELCSRLFLKETILLLKRATFQLVDDWYTHCFVIMCLLNDRTMDAKAEDAMSAAGPSTAFSHNVVIISSEHTDCVQGASLIGCFGFAGW
jgi:hypothetical protein